MENKNTRRGFTQNCHAELQPLPLGCTLKSCYSGSNKTVSASTPLVIIQNKEEILNQVQDDNVIITTRGFTLIELLVVVLIIGILAAVAVPQYKLAVVKSRVATLLPVLKNISEVQEAYFLANGTYAKEISSLDIELPSSYTPVTYNYNGSMFAIDNNFLIDMNASDGKIAADYCPDNNTTWASCASNRDFIIIFYWNHAYDNTENSGKRYCQVFHDSKLGQSMCNSFIYEIKQN